MNKRKTGSSDEFYIGVIKQVHNGPVRVVSMAASDIEEAREKCNRLCYQLTPDAGQVEREKDLDPNTRWFTLTVVNVDDIRTVEGLSVSMKVVHDNKYGNQPEPPPPVLKLITHTARGEA
jgi:hypothetical protein